VLSRYPIVAENRPQMGAGTCDCQRVTVDLDGHRITVINAHPTSPDVEVRRVGRVPLPRGFATADTEQAVAVLLEQARTIEPPLLVLGDLNTSDRQPSYHLIWRSLGDAHREAGWGFGYTFPAEPVFRLALIPLVRIDYVLHDRAWASRAAWTVDLPGSDHRGVAADLVLTQR
jgi:vancomycin resistance protein VanJ